VQFWSFWLKLHTGVDVDLVFIQSIILITIIVFLTAFSTKLLLLPFLLASSENYSYMCAIA
jgi:hypothetical protein